MHHWGYTSIVCHVGMQKEEVHREEGKQGQKNIWQKKRKANSWNAVISMEHTVDKGKTIVVGFSHAILNILVTFVYAKNIQYERRVLWQELSNIHMEDFLWLVGDFNVFHSNSERISGNPRPLVAKLGFNDCLDFYGLVDLRSQSHNDLV